MPRHRPLTRRMAPDPVALLAAAILRDIRRLDGSGNPADRARLGELRAIADEVF